MPEVGHHLVGGHCDSRDGVPGHLVAHRLLLIFIRGDDGFQVENGEGDWCGFVFSSDADSWLLGFLGALAGLPEQPFDGFFVAHAGDFEFCIEHFELCESSQGLECGGSVGGFPGGLIPFGGRKKPMLDERTDRSDDQSEVVLTSQRAFLKSRERGELGKELLDGFALVEFSGEVDLKSDGVHERFE